MQCNLGKGDVLRLDGKPKGVVLFCLRGTVWVTNGDGADYLVPQGSNFKLAADETAVVEALGLAEVRLETAAAEGRQMRPILSQIACRPL